MLAIVCPGQGAQKPGFLTPWLDLPGVREKLATLSEQVGVDLIRHGTESDADTIRDTAIAQPLLVAAGIVAAGALAQDEPLAHRAGVIAGHSVGELTAAAIAGVLSDAEAMALVGERSRAMARAAAEVETSMAAVVGGQREDVMSAIERHGLHAANINSAAQVVAAGAPDALAALGEDAPARARVIPLQVAGAFHTPFMASARESVAALAQTLHPQDPDPRVALLTNRGGERIGSGPRFVELIVGQIDSPVDWEACMGAMGDLGVSGVLELMPAGTLTGLAKRELKGTAQLNLNTPDELDAARAFVREHSLEQEQN